MKKYWNEKTKKLMTEVEMKKVKAKVAAETKKDAEVEEAEQTEAPEEDAEVVMGEETPVDEKKPVKKLRK